MVNMAAATRATSSGLLKSGGSVRPSAKAAPAAKPTTAALTTVNGARGHDDRADAGEPDHARKDERPGPAFDVAGKTRSAEATPAIDRD